MSTPQVQLPATLQSFRDSVQRNCHISDARYASDFTMCVYLLKMREYFRWEKGYGFAAALPHKELGDWLTEREALWEQLENKDFAAVELHGREYDPFDSDAINEALQAHRLLYSAGYGDRARPHFFLAQLEKTVTHDHHSIHVSSREYARDLGAPPAMSLDRRIYIRRESLRRMLWERLEEWRWSKPDNAMGRAIACYDFTGDLDAALEQMSEVEIETLTLHEIGEVRAGELLDDSWHEMISAFPRSRLELMARAVRDHLADALCTLPGLIERAHPPSLHFYFANLSGMRKQIYPALLNAYEHWVEYGDCDRLEAQVSVGREHWTQVAHELIELHESRVTSAWQDMESLIEQKQL
ncbi:MAG: Sfum_1244 family protein [Thiogranum sp.]